MQEENNSLKIALLEQRMTDFSNVISRLESAIVKISEVNTNIIKMLAVHEEKIGQNERNVAILSKMDDDIKSDAFAGRKETIEKTNQLSIDIEHLNRFKWMSVAFGMVAALVIAGLFQVASTWNVNINQNQPTQPLTTSP